MVEGKQLSNVLCAPLECGGQKPAESKHEPPQEGSHHCVVEETKDDDTRRMLPAPDDGAEDKLSPRTGDVGSANRHREEVGQ